MFYISFTQLVLERNGGLSYEVDLIKAPKSFDVHAMQQMRYHQDNKDEYYYQDEFCMIYEDRFIFYEKVPNEYVLYKTTPSSTVASSDSLTNANEREERQEVVRSR